MDTTPCHTKIHKTHDKIIGTRYGNLPEHVYIQKWDIKQSKPSGNHLGITKPRPQQAENKIWILHTSIHMHHQQDESENSGRNRTMLRKRMGWILLHVSRYWETSSFIHIDKVTNKQASNKKVRQPGHEGKTTRNDQRVPNF